MFPYPLLVFHNAVSTVFSVSVVELTQWTILIALFSQSVPPSCVCYCRTGGYAGHGGNAEPAESEHFLSNNLKFCRLMGGGLTKYVYQSGGSGHLPVELLQSARSPGLSRYVKGSASGAIWAQELGMQAGLHVCCSCGCWSD